jgi:hypothetical protein
MSAPAGKEISIMVLMHKGNTVFRTDSDKLLKVFEYEYICSLSDSIVKR